MKKVAWFSLALCACGAYLVLGSASGPVCGQPVLDEVAAEARGGGCDTYKTEECPKNDTDGCKSCTRVVDGDNDGHDPYAKCYCDDMCDQENHYDVAYKAGCAST